MKTFEAVYLPAKADYDPSKGGFSSEEEAWKYVLKNHLCSMCREELENFEKGIEDDPENGVNASPFPSCSAEWIVVPEGE